MAGITFDDVTKTYGDGHRAVSDLNLDVQDGEFVVLVGPSGCGKTTALRMIAGLEEISGGEIRIGDRVVNNLPPGARDIAMVFQNYALYPHMTVAENIGFALRMRKVPKAEARRRIEETARIIGLVDHLDRKPGQLSGGQRQRVAMGRAIVREPQVFLMDEPLSNLDAKLRVQMRAEISRIQRQLAVTTVYVTHDQVEAMTMGDRVAVMRRGLLQQFDAPQRLYERPANLFVASFMGSPAMNVLEGSLEREGDALICRVGTAALALRPEVRARGPRSRASWGGRSRSASGRKRSTSPAVATAATEAGCADASRPSRRSAPNSSCTSRSTPSPSSSTTCSRGSSTWTGPAIWRRSESTRTAPALPSSPGSRRRQSSGPTSRSSLRSTSATCTSSISAAARRSVTETSTAIDHVRLTLLDGSTFVVCDQRGDVDGVSAASGFFAADTRFLSRSVLTIDGDRGNPVAFEQVAPHVAGLRPGVGERVGGAARALRRSRSRRGGNCQERVRPRGGGGARAGARIRLRRHLRGQARGGPWRAGHVGGGAVATGALAGRAHRRVRGPGLPGADARASGPGARRGGRRHGAVQVAARARRALAPRRRRAMASERDTGARRCRVRGGAPRRSARPRRFDRRLVALGAAAAGTGRSRARTHVGAIARGPGCTPAALAGERDGSGGGAAVVHDAVRP